MYRTAIGQDSHRFEPESSSKPLMLGGIPIEGCVGLDGNSDADVILHAITNAVSGISGVTILGKISDQMCLEHGITNSTAYLDKALETLGDYTLTHVSISVEAKRPRLEPHIEHIRASVAKLLRLETTMVGITATTGEGLNGCGRGEGIGVLVIATAVSGIKRPAGLATE